MTGLARRQVPVARHPEPDLRFEMYCRISAMLWTSTVEAASARRAIVEGRDPAIHLALATQVARQAVVLGLTLHGRGGMGLLPTEPGNDGLGALELLVETERLRPEDPYADIAQCARTAFETIDRSRAFTDGAS